MKRNIVESYSIEEAFKSLNNRGKFNEDFENVATLEYMYISNTGDEYEDIMTDEEIDNAYNTESFTDEMWLKGEAYITKENGSYQVSWGDFDDYREASSIEKCKKIVQKYHPYGFKWILDTNKSQNVIESLTSSWIDIQNQIALEREDGINPLYDDSTAGDYVLELMGKIEKELDVEVVPSVQGGYGDVYIHLGDSHANAGYPIGPINFTEFSNQMINLVLEADTESDFIDNYRAEILAYM